MKLQVKQLTKDSFVPTKAHESDAGYDLYSPIAITLEPGKPTKIPTGIAIQVSGDWGIYHNLELDRLVSYDGHHSDTILTTSGSASNFFGLEVNHVGLIQDRSSMGSKGIKVLGGVCDSSYRGDVTVCLINLTNQPYQITRGDKIAQILFLPILSPEIVVVDSLDETERGEKGFGSSGL